MLPMADYFFSASILPPLSLHSFSDRATKPLPLQEFMPLQALSAVLQSDLPLQALTPVQCTMPPSAATAVAGIMAVANRPAAAVAMARPVSFFLLIIVESPVYVEWCKHVA